MLKASGAPIALTPSPQPLPMFTRWISTWSPAPHAPSHSLPFTANSVAGLAIDDALADHLQLRRQLQRCALGQPQPELKADTLCFDDRCLLGQWLHGPARHRLGGHRGFVHLVEQHRMFHIAASNVVALADAGKLPQAQHMASVQLEAFSQGVVQRLRAMQGWVQRRSQRRRPGLGRAPIIPPHV